MNIHISNIKDLFVIKSEKFKDQRGWFQESYNYNEFNKLGINDKFVQDNFVHSKANVLRGLHFQKNDSQGKLISCIKGKIFDVAVDLRLESDTYKNWVGFFLSELTPLISLFAVLVCWLSDFQPFFRSSDG